MGGFKSGGLNFGRQGARESFRASGPLFHAHIGGMDAFARGLKIAAAIRKDGRLAEFVKKRYASWDTSIGRDIETGNVGLEELEAYNPQKSDSTQTRAVAKEMLENIINEFHLMKTSPPHLNVVAAPAPKLIRGTVAPRHVSLRLAMLHQINSL